MSLRTSTTPAAPRRGVSALIGVLVVTALVLIGAEPATAATFSSVPKPTLSGTAAVGSVLTAAPGTWKPTPKSITYQWSRNGTAIAKATARTYKLTQVDAGTKITVSTTGTRSGYTTARATSAAKAVPTTAFVKTAAPTISGTIVVGSTLTAVPGIWSPTATFAYQWNRDGIAIANAKARTYKLTQSDAGTKVSVTTTGTRGGYTTARTTSASKSVPTTAFTKTAAPTVVGNPVVGSVLSVTPGSWSPAAVFSYQWSRNGAPITSATASTYKLVQADAGTKITVATVGTRSGYTATRTISAAVTIGTLTFSVAPLPTITGAAVVGSALTAVPGAWSPAPSSYGYQWMRDGQPLSGRTAKTYLLSEADAGHVVAVAVRGDRSGYVTTTRTSTPVNVPGAVVHVDADVTADATWRGVVVLDRSVEVAAGTTLTIEPGTVVKATGGTWQTTMLDVRGALVAKGTASSPVTFTSLYDDSVGGDTNSDGDATVPSPSDWSGISVGQTGSIVAAYARMSYSGTAVRSGGAVTDLSHVTISHTQYEGVDVNVDRSGINAGSATVKIQDSTVSDAGGVGIAVWATGTPQGSGTQVPVPVVRGNTVTGARSYGIQIRGDAIDGALIRDNAGSGNGINTIDLSGTLTTDTAVPLGGLPVSLGAGGNAYGLTVKSGVTLTVAAGQTVKAIADRNRTTMLDVRGALVAKGTASSPVTFTSLYDDSVGGDTNSDGDATVPSPLDWSGISVGQTGSIVAAYARMSYSGTAVRSGGAVTDLSHVTISHTQYEGVDVNVDRSGINAGSATVKIQDSTVSDAGGVGIAVWATGTPQGSGTQVPVPVVRGNTVTGARSYGIQIRGDAIDGALIRDNAGSGNGINTIDLSGTLVTDTAVPLGGLPVSLGAGGNAYGLTVKSGVTLTVAAGQTVKAIADRNRTTMLDVRGALVAKGTASSPVTFTSLYDDSVGGDTNSDGDATVPSSSDWSGISVSGDQGRATLDGTTIGFARTALSVSGAQVSWHGKIIGCETGIWSDGTYVDARDVDWGSSAGPQEGDITGQGVAYVPWVGYVAPPRPTVAPAQPVPSGNSSTCKAFTVFGLRGSDESPQGQYTFGSGWSVPDFGPEPEGFGTMNGTVFDAFKKYEGRSMKQVSIQYQALAVPVFSGKPVSPKAYNDSIFDGVDKLIARMNQEETDCPDARFVIIAYSQGALSAHIALRTLDRTDRAMLAKVAGVAFISDPGRVLGSKEEWWASASVTDDTLTVKTPSLTSSLSEGSWSTPSLITQNANGPLPDAVIGQTVELCHDRDIVCTAYLGGTIKQHENYTADELNALGYMLARKVV